jgi:ABC-type Fe3+ transport system permease subunit
MNVLEYLNPQHYVTSERYVHMWQGLIATLLLGFWARFLAAACIFLAFYFMVRRQRYQAGVWFIVLASILIYGGTVLKFFSIL